MILGEAVSPPLNLLKLIYITMNMELPISQEQQIEDLKIRITELGSDIDKRVADEEAFWTRERAKGTTATEGVITNKETLDLMDRRTKLINELSALGGKLE